MEENFEKPFWKHRLKQLTLGPPFHHEPHYAALSMAISIITTVILYYHLPNGWENHKFFVWLYKSLSIYIPAIETFENIENIDNNYWKSFSAFHFFMLPFHFLIGIASGFFIDSKFKKIYNEISTKKYILIYFSLIICIISMTQFPLINMNGRHGFYFDQLSDFFPKLLLSWFFPTVLLYASGHIVAIALQRKFRKEFFLT